MHGSLVARWTHTASLPAALRMRPKGRRGGPINITRLPLPIRTILDDHSLIQFFCSLIFFVQSAWPGVVFCLLLGSHSGPANSVALSLRSKTDFQLLGPWLLPLPATPNMPSCLLFHLISFLLSSIRGQCLGFPTASHKNRSCRAIKPDRADHNDRHSVSSDCHLIHTGQVGFPPNYIGLWDVGHWLALKDKRGETEEPRDKI